MSAAVAVFGFYSFEIDHVNGTEVRNGMERFSNRDIELSTRFSHPGLRNVLKKTLSDLVVGLFFNSFF